VVEGDIPVVTCISGTDPEELGTTKVVHSSIIGRFGDGFARDDGWRYSRLSRNEEKAKSKKVPPQWLTSMKSCSKGIESATREIDYQGTLIVRHLASWCCIRQSVRPACPSGEKKPSCRVPFASFGLYVCAHADC
jgi:hypothetical protein